MQSARNTESTLADSRSLSHNAGVEETTILKAPNGLSYCFDETTGLYHRVDPETGKKITGRPRKTLPQLSPKGLTKKGTPRKHNYTPDRKAPTEYYAQLYHRTRKRKLKKHETLNKKIHQAKKELESTQKLNELIAKAPTSKELQQAVLAMFAEKNFNPIEEMVRMVQKGEVGAKEKISLLKALSDFYPKPKSIDIQGNIESSIVVQVTDFNTRKAIKAAEPAPDLLEAETVPSYDDAAYEEFEGDALS